MDKEQIFYIQKNLKKPISLVGMMGAGKSHSGRALAQTLNFEFYDSDQIIEEKAGQPITGIFKTFGEKKFREAERNTILDLLSLKQSVIATGGGAVTTPEVLSALKKDSLMVWLSPDLQTLWERVQKSQSRPLLQAENPWGKLERLMEERLPLYEQAHIRLEIRGDSQSRVMDDLIKALYDFVNKDTV